ncbi:SH3 domain-containing protein [Desulfitibacter alkalitolerans]|uniref:SH3 domain-containing protein n=1 Tax=Desulfitibacter alkalitolerans TaxID=264641 RepID=UPI000485B357|nr:SH3 domain-containing protein [Desulfitibacter alkalitolerans]
MRFFKLWVGIAMVAALVLGITLGNFVVAGGFMPGSSQDPLVSESYIVQTVEEKTAALEFQIFELEKQITSLTSTVAALEAQLGRTSTGSSSASQSGQSNQTKQTNQSNQTSPTNQTSQSSQTGSPSTGTSNTNQNNNSSGTTPSSGTARVMEVAAAAGVNVRSGPSTSFAIIASLGNGTKVSVVSESSGWYEIIIEGNKTGWVHGDFVK